MKGGRIAALTAMGLVLVAVAALGCFRLYSVMREDAEPLSSGSSVAAGDVTLSYRTWGPESGFPVLLVHGSFAWSQTWDVLAAPLAERGYRVVALDIPPFGYSQKPADGTYTRQAQASRILRAASELNLQRFALVGHSFGAGAAVEAAFAAPDRIAALVLIAAALGLDDPSSGSGMSALFSVPLLAPALSAATFANPMLTAAGLKAFVHDDQVVTAERTELYQQPMRVAQTASAVARWVSNGLYGDTAGAPSADPNRFRTFDAPSLIVWGVEDTATPLEQGKTIARLMPNAQLVELPETGHIPHLEKPREVVEAVAGFLEQVQ